MSLPSTYQRTKDHFEAALVFLKNYQWLYNSPNTHIFKVFREFPADWSLYFKNLTTERLNDISQGILSDENVPPSLQQFFDNIQKLKINWTTKSRVCEYKFPNNSGLSQKKAHEILSLAPLVDEVCKAHFCDYVIDVGAGLGYLSQLLHKHYQYSVLGIEGSPERVRQANANRNKYSRNSEDSVQFVEHFITDDSAGFIRNMTIGGNACIAGLHACADLSVTMLNLFVQLDFAKALVVMPCCYHRMELADDVDGRYFKRFPASGVLKDLYRSLEAYRFLQVPFLRLACQNSVDKFSQMTEDQHRSHAKRCLFRAILQEVAETEHCRVTRLKRKSGRVHHDAGDAMQLDDDEGFEDYLANLTHTHALIGGGGDINNPDFLQKMRDKWSSYKEKLYLVVAVQALQAALQGVCEDVVMLDRVELLTEKGMDCTIERVTDRRISPRCYAVVATKQ